MPELAASLADRLHLRDRHRPETMVCNVHEFGARGDGKADETAAFQKAAAAIPATGGTLVIPAGAASKSGLCFPEQQLIKLQGGTMKHIWHRQA